MGYFRYAGNKSLPKRRRSCIYGLFDPRDKRLYYVGQTVNAKSRKYAHEMNKHKRGSVLFAWIAGLHQEGWHPIFKILEECDEGELNEKEKWWIQEAAKSGSPLLNQNKLKQEFPRYQPPIVVSKGTHTPVLVENKSQPCGTPDNFYDPCPVNPLGV